MASNDDEVYFFDLLKGGLTDSSMSAAARTWCITIGAIGTVLFDPVLFVCNKLHINGGSPSDPDDPNSPMNTNY